MILRYCIVSCLAGLLAALPAMAQVSGVDLLRVSPNSPSIIRDDRNDETSEKGAAVGMPALDFDEDEPVTVEANEVGFDQQNAIVVARGNVQVVQGAYILSAQQLTYFQRSNLVKASGDVSILQPTGDVYFADQVELNSGMKTGVIHHFQARLSDNSVFAAEEARKVSASVTELKQAAYTPCNLCDGMAPFWQLKASDVQIDEADERVRYANAHMEMFGVPMFYTPVMSHPTPDSAAKSGLLTPTYATNGQLGTVVKAPYYWRISPDQDLTLTPWYTGEGPLLQGDYRRLSDGGDYSVRFSGTNPDQLDAAGNKTSGQEFRGHIYAEGKEAITDYSRVGFDIARSTDDTYLRRYGFGDQRVLFSRLYGEAAQDRNYVLAQGLAIQGLRATDDSDTTPLVLPTFEGYYETKPYESGLTLHAFANAQSLTREEGADERRLSITTGGSLPMVTDSGHVFTATANLRQDLYQVNDVPINNNTSTYDGTQGRILPQAALEWRYPLIRSFGGDAMTVEPIVLAVAQTTTGNKEEIPNEDNTLIELTDTNLFSLDRMPGLDTVDTGSRVAYGFRSQYLFAGGQSIDTMLGQTYNMDDDTPFPNSTTPGENASDYIGRIALDYRPISLGYRFALDRSTLAANRNEFSLRLDQSWATVEGVYRSLENNRYLRDSEEGILNASVPVGDEWTVYGGLRRDMVLDQMIASNLGLLYRNECFNLMLQSLRTFTRDRDVEPNTSFTLRIGFKNLGEFGDN